MILVNRIQLDIIIFKSKGQAQPDILKKLSSVHLCDPFENLYDTTKEISLLNPLF